MWGYGSGALLIGLLSGSVSTFGFAVVMPYFSQNYDLQVRRICLSVRLNIPHQFL